MTDHIYDQPTQTAPVVILGPHRSGTSAVTGALHQQGLHLGAVIPPAADNPKGFFENQAILDAHVDLLASMQRDWLTPPEWFDPAAHDLTSLAQAAHQVDQAAGGRWGIKDPRLLYLLPAWTTLFDSLSFVGVVRSPASVAASLAHRNQMDYGEALLFAERQIERLADLWQHYQFPVVEFGVDHDQWADRVARLGAVLGLAGPDSAEPQLDPALVHHEASDSSSDAYEMLRRAAKEPITGEVVVQSQELAAALSSMVRPGRDIAVDRSSVMAERRLRGHKTALSYPVSVSNLVEIPVASSSEPAAPTSATHESVSHLIGAGVVDRWGIDGLQSALERFDPVTNIESVAVFDGFVIDDIPVPATRQWPQLAAITQRFAAPYHVHVDELRAAAVTSHWLLASVTPVEDGSGRSMIAYVKEPALRREQRTNQELEDQIAERDQAVEIITAQLIEQQQAEHEIHAKYAALEARYLEEVAARTGDLMPQLKRVIARLVPKSAVSLMGRIAQDPAAKVDT